MHFFNSKYPNVELLSSEHEQLSYLYLEALDKHADRVILIDSATKSRWTGSKIKKAALAIAASLVYDHNVEPGDICGILYNNCDWSIISYLAIVLAGGTVSSHCYGDPYDEFRYTFGCVSPKLIITSSHLHSDMVRLRKDLGINFQIFWMDNGANITLEELSAENLPAAQIKQMVAYSNIANIETLPIECDPDTAALILFTSGSTGLPKAVARSRKNEAYVSVSLNNAVALWNLDHNSVLAGHLTLAHGTGTFCVHQSIVRGCKLIMQDGYDADQLLANIEEYKITSLMLGSARLQNLMLDSENVAKYDISSLCDVIVIGGRIPSAEVANQFMDMHPNCFVRQCYGISETGLVSIVRQDMCRDANSGAGELLPSVKVRLIDSDHQTDIDKRGVSGELIIYSPFISPGYYGIYNKKSDKVFLADGGYCSGDIANISNDDQLQLQGRISEVLCLDDAWKVSPEIIEAIVMEHEWVKEVAVIGVPSKTLPGCHDPRAYVVLKNNYPNEVNEESICDFVAERVSEPKRLHAGLKIIGDFPRTTIGKINRKLLRESPLYN